MTIENRATYCPEDNRIRLYVGRVPRDEYEKLREEGWTSTPKQECDFVATWTPQRRRTALEYADLIEDEDQSPEDRAADRAERFGEYRDKRHEEATGHADTYDAGPSAHGFQSQARAERAARRHDRQAGYACDAWSKAEYWTRRTAGVINHALYKSTPAVRMGRIKELEAEIRRLEANFTPQNPREIMQKNDTGELVPFVWTGQGRGGYWTEKSRLPAIERGAHEWLTHLHLRLAYETQMLEAQGGRAAFVEMEPGGFIGAMQIEKVNKSNATGRTVSVLVYAPSRANYDRAGKPYGPENPRPMTLHTVKVERLPVNAYRPPTDEERTAFAQAKKQRKAAAPKADPCPLVNPTDEDAARLQEVLNERAKEIHADALKRNKTYGDFVPAQIIRIKQATYSAASQGAYARAETSGLCRNMELEPRASNMYSRHEQEEAKRRGPAVCKIRTTSGGDSWYTPRSIIVITDKPQKAFPAAVWSLPTVYAAPDTAARTQAEFAL